MRSLSHKNNCCFSTFVPQNWMEEYKMNNEIIKQSDATCYYFKGLNCSVCTVLEPKIAKLVKKTFPKIEYRLVEANTDTDLELAAQKNVFSAPTIIVEFEGKEIMRKGRNLSLGDFEIELQRYYNLFFS